MFEGDHQNVTKMDKLGLVWFSIRKLFDNILKNKETHSFLFFFF